MSFKSTLISLLENLSEQTVSGRIFWNLKDKTTAEVVIDTIIFQFHISWKLELAGYTMSGGWISIKDEKDPECNFIVHRHEFTEDFDKIKNYLCNKYFNSLKPSEQPIIDKLENISKSLSLESYRDKKISNILNNDV